MDAALQEEFFQALMRGQRGQVQAIAAQHPEVLLARNANGLSPVMVACYYGQLELAADLVNLGAPLNFYEAAAVGDVQRVQALLDEDQHLINSFSTDGFQALHLAAFFGRTEVVRLLAQRGARVNTYSRNGFGVMPLHSAVAGQHLEASRILLENGADPNAVQSEEFTPLMAAAQNGQASMVALLLQHGADPAARTRDGRAPADFAREKGFGDLGL